MHPQFAELTPRWFKRAFVYTGKMCIRDSSSSWCPRSAYRNWPASMQNGKNDWQYWTTYIQDKNNTVWKATLNVAESANGVKYLYDINPIKKVGQSVKSDTSTTSVGQMCIRDRLKGRHIPSNRVKRPLRHMAQGAFWYEVWMRSFRKASPILPGRQNGGWS